MALRVPGLRPRARLPAVFFNEDRLSPEEPDQKPQRVQLFIRLRCRFFLLTANLMNVGASPIA